MTAVTRLLPDPKFRITLVYHPDSVFAAKLAEQLETHFFGGPFRDASPGLGIDVSFRVTGAAVGDDRPLPVGFSDTRCDAVVLLADDILVTSIQGGSVWDGYIADLFKSLILTGGKSSLFPAALDASALPAHSVLRNLQHIRWFEWDDDEGRERRLIRELTHAFCTLVRPWVDAVEKNEALPPANAAVPDPVKVFISHSKSDGAKLAKSVRRHIEDESHLKTFFDAYDIRPGTTFTDVIETSIRNSVLLVVQTDTFASREWCRLEVLTARRLGVPVVVMHAVREREARAFPYLGNVPVIVNLAGTDDRIAEAVGALLDETLLSLYWRLHRKELQNLSGDALALVIPYAPDLLTLVQCATMPKTIVYPDPPLGQAESELLGHLAADVRLQTPMSLFVE